MNEHGAEGVIGCRGRQQDLILDLYEELSAPDRRELEAHVGQCVRCRDELSGFRLTFRAIDEAGLRETATIARPGDWTALERKLLAEQSRWHARISPAPLLVKAAAVILVAGASFVAGRQWETIETTLMPAQGITGSTPGEAPTEGDLEAMDTAERFQAFSERTNGYLDRSRLVLLEFANAEPASAPPELRAASRSLLREYRVARQVADQMADQRLEGLLVELENVLREIARLTDQGDMQTIDRIRARLDESGLIEQLEILSILPNRLAQRRPRT